MNDFGDENLQSLLFADVTRQMLTFHPVCFMVVCSHASAEGASVAAQPPPKPCVICSRQSDRCLRAVELAPFFLPVNDIVASGRVEVAGETHVCIRTEGAAQITVVVEVADSGCC